MLKKSGKKWKSSIGLNGYHYSGNASIGVNYSGTVSVVMNGHLDTSAGGG